MATFRARPGRVPAPGDRAAELLNRMSDPNDQEAANLFAGLFGDVEGDQDYRFGAPSKVSQQDEHLETWISVLRLYNHSTPGFADLTDKQVVAQTIKNATHEQVLANLQIYLRGVVGFLAPRTAIDERPRYSTLLSYRSSAIFWIEREMKKKAPPKDDILNAANQTLQRMARKWGVNKKRKVKTYLGRYELSQLIDWDTARSPFMPVTETHHLAWCMALICGVRPGSIGRAPQRDNQYLCFREIEISRGPARGMFNAKIQFLYLKGNRDSLVPEDGLTFSINGSIRSETLPMSIPHRLLVMLLRRGGLEDHHTIDSLLGGSEHYIAIKEDFLDQPVCRAPGPRMLSITDEAISAQGLSNFLSEHAMDAGYPLGITMYAWRRKAATNWMRSVGADEARRMMGHAPGTTTLEDHYDQGFFDHPVFETAMRESTDVAKATMDIESSEVLGRMVDYKRLHGAFLNRQVTQLLEDNPEYHAATERNDVRAMISMEAKTRKFAIRAFHEERSKINKKNLSQAEFERRKAALKKPGELVQRIRNVVRNKLKDKDSTRSEDAPSRQEAAAGRQTSNQRSQTGQSGPNTELQELEQDGDLEGDDLVDAEDDYANREERAPVSIGTDKTVSWDEDREESQEEFSAAVEVFMTELGKERFHIPDTQICDLCRNSPWQSEANKDKVWASPAKLKAHQLGRAHSKQGEIYLKLQYLKEYAGSNKFKCPYGDCKAEYLVQEDLVRHIKRTRAPLPEEDLEADERLAMLRHDNEKRADGWYDDDFSWDPQKKADVLNANRRRNLGLQYTGEKELPEPKQVQIQSSYKVTVGGGDAAMMTKIPEHYKGIIAFGDDEESPYEHTPPVSAFTATGDEAEYVHPLRVVPSQHLSALAMGDTGRPFEHPGLWKEFAQDD